jgi:hypothetical protein
MGGTSRTENYNVEGKKIPGPTLFIFFEQPTDVKGEVFDIVNLNYIFFDIVGRRSPGPGIGFKFR